MRSWNHAARLLAASAISVIVLGGCASNGSDTHPAEQRTITQDERVYIGAFGSYQMGFNKVATKIATSMAGLNTGSSTLGAVEREIDDGKLLEAAAFLCDYKDKVKTVPPTLTNLYDIGEEQHRCFQAAMDEYAAYFKTSNHSRILSGHKSFERALKLHNSGLDTMHREMEKLKP